MNKFKRIFPVLMLIMYVTSCGYGKIKFGKKQDFENKETVQSENRTETESEEVYYTAIEEVESEDIESQITKEVESADNIPINEVSIMDRVERIVPDYPIPHKVESAINSLDEKFKKDVLQEKDEAAVAFGRTLLIIGIIMFLVASILLLYWLQADNVDSSSADGCLTSILLLLAYIVLGIGMGIVGLVMILIGIIVMSSGQRIKDQPKNTEPPTKKA